MEPLLSTEQIVFVFGNRPVTVGEALIAAGLLIAAIVAWSMIASARSRRLRRQDADAARLRAEQAEAQVAAIVSAQNEMQGRLASMTEIFGSRQNQLSESLQNRLDAMTTRIGQSMSESQKSTQENLSRLQERLKVIDIAQSNIQNLAGQVVELQSILDNKQTRGAFGQTRMEAILADGLPMGTYEFQPTLSNNMRPDAIVRMPNDAPGLVIDAKFPLEAWNDIRAAGDKGDDPGEATKQFRRDMDVHIKAIAEKYLIAGETQETAFLFVPSESIFADIHEHHEVLIQRAHKARIVIVSPSLLMLSVQVIQALLKDVRMREQAHLIQTEVLRLMEDVTRLDDRVQNLQRHFGQANKDIDEIVKSSTKITRRGNKIEALEFEEPDGQSPEPDEKTADSKTGHLRLRVVDGDE